MKAIVYSKKHLPDKLRLEEVEKPAPGNNEILVKNICVSLNAADYRSMKLGMTPKKKIFGSAISGTVEEAGKNVKRFKPGDHVFGDLADCGFGGLAEYVVATENVFALKPDKVSFEDVVALPIAATTALSSLRDFGKIEDGNNVLIVGSAGGVGPFAVQLARYYGANVTAVCSTRNIDQAVSLGAHKVIDYTKESFLKGKNLYDIIVAINGNYPLLAYRRLLTFNGIYTMVGGSLSQILKSLFMGWLLSLGNKKMKNVSGKVNPDDLGFLAELLDKGKIKTIIEKRYSFDKAPEAMTFISKGHASGKVIINI